MPGPSRAQVKLACLACRASKTRCDGKRPCEGCYTNGRECYYRPSRRGGARRGVRYENAKKGGSASNVSASPPAPFASLESTGTFLETMMGLVSPLSDVQDTPCAPPGDSFAGSPRPTGRKTATVDSFESRTASQPNFLTLRGYEADEDLINAYYVYIHPYFPLLPRNAVSIFPDRPVRHSMRTGCVEKSALPQWPSNPFVMALLSILVLIPINDDPRANCEDEVELRRSYAELYARSALEAVEDSIERSASDANCNSSRDVANDQKGDLHPNVPKKLEPVLALAVLSLYEYCQRGSKSRMRIRANHALMTAMDMGLHTLAPNMPEGFDAHRRAWWMTVFLVYHSSILNDLPPMLLADDPRITTPYPEFRGCLEAWPLMIKAHETLLQSSRIAKELTNDNRTSRLSQSLRDRIRKLDGRISSLASESDRSRCVTNQQGSESNASRNMWVVARVLIHSSRITLHRFRAFLEHPVFPDNDGDLKSVNDIEYLHSPQRLLPGRAAQIQSVFPFTEQESAMICLKSALVISRIFRHLPSPNPDYSDTDLEQITDTCKTRPRSTSGIYGCPRSLPYLACYELQTFYVLVMLLRRVRASAYLGDISSCYYLLGNPLPESEVQDAERLIEELRHALASLSASIRADTVFGGMVSMAREVEEVYYATFPD